MATIDLQQVNWTGVVIAVQTLLLALALFDVELGRFLILQFGLVLLVVGGGIFLVLQYGRRGRLWLASLMLKYQDKLLGGASKVFTISPSKRALAYFGVLGKLVTKPKLWELQPILPRLPVPPLEQTCSMFLKSVRPLLTDEEFQETSRAVQDFLTPGGPASQAQALLLRRAQDPNCPNWLEEIWEKVAYLSNRDALPLSSNWYGVDRPHPTAKDVVTRASSTAAAILSFKELIDKEELEPILLYNAVPLCMEQYRRMFNTSRVPSLGMDTIVHHPEARHFVVIYRGQWFNFNAYNPDGVVLSRQQLSECFRYVIETVQRMPDSDRLPSVGALTSQNRDEWAKWRNQLVEDGNGEQINIVESALGIMVLEDESPEGTQALAERAAKGNPDHRWFDKCGTYIFWNNGRFCGNFEHTWGDAPVMVNMMTYMFGVEDAKSGQGLATPLLTKPGGPAPPPVVQIRWNITEEVATQIQVAKREYQEKIVENGVDIFVLEFDQFGKTLIKKAKLSPDGFCQMALQLAYYMRHNRLCLTYESSHTRIYLHGRTETVRSASTEALAFVQSMCNPEAGDSQRIALLKVAVDAHIAYMRKAMSGNGVDRHLLGLLVTCKQAGLPIPALFLDKAWNLQFQLSTSQTPGYQTGGGGFNPVCHNGYGASYVVNDDSLVFHISAWKTCPDTGAREFATALSEALTAMRGVLLTDAQMRRNLSHTQLVQMAQLEAD